MKYDLIVSDGSEEHGYCFLNSEQPSCVIEHSPIDVPTVTTSSPAQGGGPYDVTAASDYKRLVLRSWHGGAGQESYDIGDWSGENSLVPSKFWASQNLDVSEKGILKLGPSVTAYTTDPTTIQGVTAAGLGVVWSSFDPAGADPRNQLRYSTDNVTWTPVVYSGDDPPGSVTALACDGQYEYAAFSGTNGVWRGKTTGDWTEYCPVASGGDGIVGLAFAGGYLYGAKGSSSVASSAGYFNPDSSNAYTTLSPAFVNQTVTTVALVPIGNLCYWVTYGGSVTNVYLMQHDPTSGDVFQCVGTFPKGFRALCAHGYLGNLYIGGYWESYTSGRGIGAVYLLSGSDQNLLFQIGTDETQDWRVLFLSSYEKHLYFVCNGSIYKWSLVDGGYSHVCPVAGGVTPAGETWDIHELMNAEPSAGWTTTETGGTLTVDSADGQTTWGQETSTDTVYAGSSDAHIDSTSASYPIARVGSNLALNDSTTEAYVGQAIYYGVYQCTQAFLGFDTSSIPSTATILSATLSLYGANDYTADEFWVCARAHDWGADVTTDDFVRGDGIPAGQDWAFHTSGWASGAYNTGALATSAITKDGTTKLLVFSNKHRDGVAPTTAELLSFAASGAANKPKLVVTWIDSGTKTYTASSHAPGTAATVEAQFGTTAASAASDGTYYPLSTIMYDGSYLSSMKVKCVKSGASLTYYFGLLDSTSLWQWSSGYAASSVNLARLRMTKASGAQTVYLSGTSVLGPVNAPADATAAAFKVKVGDADNDGTWSLCLDGLLYSNDGAFDPSAGVSTSSGNLACLNDKQWVSATDTGIYMTSGQNTSGWLTTSRSASNMTTVDKMYRAVEVTTKTPLTGDQTLRAEWWIDGVAAGGATLSPTTSPTTKHTWLVDTSGHEIQVKLTLGRTNSLTPQVTGVGVKYTLPDAVEHSYMLDCSRPQMNDGKLWDEDPGAAVAFLQAAAKAGTICTLTADYGSFTGQLKSCALQKEDGASQPQGIVKLTAREMA